MPPLTFDRQALLSRLAAHEGFNGRPYTDTTGHQTILYGHNLDATPLSTAAGLFVLNEDLDVAVTALFTQLPWAADLDPVRQAVLVELAFNVGVGTLLTFVATLRAIRSANWAEAATQLLSSKWATQVKGRATELAYALHWGKWSI